MGDLGRVGIIVAARLGSRRLPRKALRPLNGVPMLAFLMRRLKSSRRSAEIILATSTRSDDDALADLAANEGVSVYRGELDDVTARYVGAAKKFRLDTVVRVTGDCPFVNGELVDYCVEAAASSVPFDLCTTKGQFPVGLDAEIYPAKLMEALHMSDQLTGEHREHLTLFLYHNRDKYRIVDLVPRKEWTKDKALYTVDVLEDYLQAQELVRHFDTPLFSIEQLAAV